MTKTKPQEKRHSHHTQATAFGKMVSSVRHIVFPTPPHAHFTLGHQTTPTLTWAGPSERPATIAKITVTWLAMIGSAMSREMCGTVPWWGGPVLQARKKCWKAVGSSHGGKHSGNGAKMRLGEKVYILNRFDLYYLNYTTWTRKWKIVAYAT